MLEWGGRAFGHIAACGANFRNIIQAGIRQLVLKLPAGGGIWRRRPLDAFKMVFAARGDGLVKRAGVTQSVL